MRVTKCHPPDRLYGDLPQFAACAFALAADREHSYTPLAECSKQELSSDLSASPAPARKTQSKRREGDQQEEYSKRKEKKVLIPWKLFYYMLTVHFIIVHLHVHAIMSLLKH